MRAHNTTGRAQESPEEPQESPGEHRRAPAAAPGGSGSGSGSAWRPAPSAQHQTSSAQRPAFRVVFNIILYTRKQLVTPAFSRRYHGLSRLEMCIYVCMCIYSY